MSKRKDLIEFLTWMSLNGYLSISTLYFPDFVDQYLEAKGEQQRATRKGDK